MHVYQGLPFVSYDLHKSYLKKKIKVNIKTAELNFKKFKLMKLLLVYAIIFSNIILPSLFLKIKSLFAFPKWHNLIFLF